MDTFSHVPPGFRFHPTDEELVDYYLRKKINSRKIDLDIIKDIDLYKIEPWDLQELCRIGTEEQNEWYFFSHKDKKYPTGTRTNRATTAGFWKATGRDKAIYSKHDLIGMRKTLVFYQGRAPNGQKSDWIMHEYRLETDENGTPQEEGWVVCRVFKKRITATTRRSSDHDSPIWYDDQLSMFMPSSETDSPRQSSQSNLSSFQNYPYSCKKELDFHYPNEQYFHLPLLESPKNFQPQASNMPLPAYGAFNLKPQLLEDQNFQGQYGKNVMQNYGNEQAVDWRVLDKFVASQLSQEDDLKKNEYSNNGAENSDSIVRDLSKHDLEQENASIDLFQMKPY